jgi:hypothetical protein
MLGPWCGRVLGMTDTRMSPQTKETVQWALEERRRQLRGLAAQYADEGDAQLVRWCAIEIEYVQAAAVELDVEFRQS